MNNILSLILLSLFVYAQTADVQQAIAVVKDPRSGINNPVQGYVHFTNSGAGVTVNMSVINVEDGIYGVHIFDFGDFRGYVGDASDDDGWRALGSIFNPDNSPHGCPDLDNSGTFAMGDLGNWNGSANNGISQQRVFNRLALTGANSIIGRTIAIYGGPDSCNDTVNDNPTIIGLGVIGIAATAPSDTNVASANPALTSGVCVLEGTALCYGDSNNDCELGDVGVALLRDVSSGSINVLAIVNNLQTQRGMHVHEFGDLSNPNGTSAGEHYNPDGHQHGLPNVNNQIHAGDLGNIQTFDNSNAFYNNTLSYTPATSFKVSNFIGRSLVIHTSFDHGNDPSCNESTTTGNSGGRYFFCVIGAANAPNLTNLYVPTIPSALTVNNTFVQVPCVGGVTTGTTTGVVATTGTTSNTTGTTGGVVVVPPNGNQDDNDENAMPQEASASALVGSFILLMLINVLIIFT